MNKLGELVKKKRESMNMSLRNFSKICGISHAYIKNIEDGDPRTGKKIVPSLSSIEKLAPILGMTLGQLLNEIGYNQQMQYNLEASDGNNKTDMLDTDKKGGITYFTEDPDEDDNININSDIKLKEFIINPQNKEYLLLSKELKENNISVEYIRSLISSDKEKKI